MNKTPIHKKAASMKMTVTKPALCRNTVGLEKLNQLQILFTSMHSWNPF